MIEHVAQAIHDHWQNGGRSWADTCERLPAQANDFRAKARAAIEAMRKPSRAMTIEAEKMGAGEAWAEDCFAAMINAALKDQ